MDVTSLYCALENVKAKEATNIPTDEIMYLKNVGLVDIMSKEEYQSQEDLAKELGDLLDRKTKLNDISYSIKDAIDSLENSLASRWHRFWSRANTLEKERSELEQKRTEYERIEHKRSQIEQQLGQAKNAKKVTERYTHQNDRYVALTLDALFLLEIGSKESIQENEINSYEKFKEYAFSVIEGTRYSTSGVVLGMIFNNLALGLSMANNRNRFTRRQKKDELSRISDNLSE